MRNKIKISDIMKQSYSIATLDIIHLNFAGS